MPGRVERSAAEITPNSYRHVEVAKAVLGRGQLPVGGAIAVVLRWGVTLVSHRNNHLAGVPVVHGRRAGLPRNPLQHSNSSPVLAPVPDRMSAFELLGQVLERLLEPPQLSNGRRRRPCVTVGTPGGVKHPFQHLPQHFPGTLLIW